MSHTVDTEAAGERANKRPGYGQLLRTPQAWTFLLPGFAARQPFAMLTIGIVLLVQHTTGSYGTAGGIAATTGVAMALFAPQSGKLADRFGQAAVLVPGVLVHAASVAALIFLALADAPLWTLFAAAVPTGASVPQIGPMVRSRWATALTRSPTASALLPTATAFESVTDEFTFVIGPVLATALCTSVHPAAGLAAEACLTLIGGLLFAARRATQPPAGGTPARAREPGRDFSAPAVAGVRVLAVSFLGIGAVFGGMQVSLTAFAGEISNPGVNGPLYGVFAAGNMLSGLIFGAVAWKSGPRRRLVLGYTGLTAVSATLWAAHSVPLLALLGLLAGLCIAPVLISGYTLVDALVESSARTEAFTWLTGAVALGQAVAVTVAGRLADTHGARAAFLVPLAGTTLALAVLLPFQSRLLPRAPVRGVIRAMGHREPTAVD